VDGELVVASGHATVAFEPVDPASAQVNLLETTSIQALVPLFEPPALEYVSTAVVELGAPLDVGESPEGRFRVVPITGGSFAGPGLARPW
jgi:hypothetical protein